MKATLINRTNAVFFLPVIPEEIAHEATVLIGVQDDEETACGVLAASGQSYGKGEGNVLNLLFIYVHPDYQGQGAGTEMMNFLIRYAEEKGYAGIQAQYPSTREMMPLWRFLNNLGFETDPEEEVDAIYRIPYFLYERLLPGTKGKETRADVSERADENSNYGSNKDSNENSNGNLKDDSKNSLKENSNEDLKGDSKNSLKENSNGDLNGDLKKHSNENMKNAFFLSEMDRLHKNEFLVYSAEHKLLPFAAYAPEISCVAFDGNELSAAVLFREYPNGDIELWDTVLNCDDRKVLGRLISAAFERVKEAKGENVYIRSVPSGELTGKYAELLEEEAVERIELAYQLMVF